ncbi:type I polyketide synthase [Thermosporothrix hazakensis]|jgi:thioester reductase-like protein|nr:type I polyketide synthase [Thermosporothrix hazakensis]GCE50447.1 hypothetical protein KTH_53160 [Thermosporothrix hazakensis]
MMEPSHESLDGVAIIGMACRFPGAPDVEAFWRLLCEGREGITFFTDEELLAAGVDPEQLAQPNYVRAASLLEKREFFDASFFGYTPREAEVMDPQHRLFLECAWHAFEHAGYNPETCSGVVGVYIGSGDNAYVFHIHAHPHIEKAIGGNAIDYLNSGDYISSRVSYKLNLKGPSLNIRSACSSSLVAIYMACQSLMSYQCDMMLAGGVSVNPAPDQGYLYEETSLLSPDGHCRAFDARAQGTIFGDGLGAVVLKRLEDAVRDGDTVYAVIKGGAITNDGASRASYSVPGVDGQATAVLEALALAGVDPSTISYVEAHAAGTPLGDSLELTALIKAFQRRTAEKSYCALGSVKSNIGYLNHASGVAGLIKTALMLKHKSMVPSLHFQQPNPQIGFATSPFYVNTQYRPWETPALPRRAGVNSLGVGGTNVHVILEEAPEADPAPFSRPVQLLVLSARTPSALEEVTAQLASHIERHPEQELADIAYTLQVGRKHFPYRRICVCCDRIDAIQELQGKNPATLLTHVDDGLRRSVIYLFPGEGSQHGGMCSTLYQEEALFRQHVDKVAVLLQKFLGEDVRALLFADESSRLEERLREPQITQPLLFMLEYALAQLWMTWGIQPDAMLGWGVGEYVAACLAGVITLEEGLELALLYGRMVQKTGGGCMLSVSASVNEVLPLLPAELSLAAQNGSTQCVVAGPCERIETLRALLSERGVQCHLLESAYAFHSPMLDPLLNEFRHTVQGIRFRPPLKRYISSVTGTWIMAEEASNPEYWVRHIRQTVQFAAGLQTILRGFEGAILLEVGPEQVLKVSAQRQLDNTPHLFLASMRREEQCVMDTDFLLQTLGKLWMAGVHVDWQKIYADERRKRVPLPGYPFERKRYWLDAPSGFYAGHSVTSPVKDTAVFQGECSTVMQTAYVAPRTELEQRLCTLWQTFFGLREIGVYDDFFELGGHSLLATQLIAAINQACQIELSVRHLLEKPTIAALAEAIEQLHRQAANEDASGPEALWKEIVLAEEIRLPAHVAAPEEPKAILLTGATGFTGAFLLSELLQRTKATVYCLVRASTPAQARERVLNNLSSRTLSRQCDLSRIIALQGDLALPCFGLPSAEFDRLAESLDVIYHNGAQVNFFYPYQTLKATNVLGTREVLRLASRTRVKPLHYISSVSVFDLDVYDETILQEHIIPRCRSEAIATANGYSLSKWVAEQIVFQYRERGLPVTIYRPGTITGHSETGVSNSGDVWLRLLMTCLRLGKAPMLDEYMEILPVDYVSKAIVYLSQQQNTEKDVFHLVSPELIPWQEVLHWLRTFGYQVELVPLSIWKSDIIEALKVKPDPDAELLLQLLEEGAASDANMFVHRTRRRNRFGCERTLERLKGSSIVYPSVDADLPGMYLHYLIDEGLIPAPGNILRDCSHGL